MTCQHRRELVRRFPQAAGGGWYLVGMGLDPLTGSLHLLGTDYARHHGESAADTRRLNR